MEEQIDIKNYNPDKKAEEILDEVFAKILPDRESLKLKLNSLMNVQYLRGMHLGFSQIKKYAINLTQLTINKLNEPIEDELMNDLIKAMNENKI